MTEKVILGMHGKSTALSNYRMIIKIRLALDRKVKDGDTTDDLFAFLTTTPNAEVAPTHPKAMPVILTDPDDWHAWLTAPWEEVHYVVDGAGSISQRILDLAVARHDGQREPHSLMVLIVEGGDIAAQKTAAAALCLHLRRKHPGAQVTGAGSYIAAPAPDFDVPSWWAGVMAPQHPTEPPPAGPRPTIIMATAAATDAWRG